MGRNSRWSMPRHAIHAAHDPFDRRVAMTIAIVAAVLACVPRSATAPQRDALVPGRSQSPADRSQHHAHQGERSVELLSVEELAPSPLSIGSEVDDRSCEGPSKASEPPTPRRSGTTRSRSTDCALPGEEQKARDMVAKPKVQKEAKEVMEKSHAAHHQANRFDWGELGVEFAVVLCSVAVLTKRRGFWFSGMAIGRWVPSLPFGIPSALEVWGSTSC